LAHHTGAGDETLSSRPSSTHPRAFQKRSSGGRTLKEKGGIRPRQLRSGRGRPPTSPKKPSSAQHRKRGKSRKGNKSGGRVGPGGELQNRSIFCYNLRTGSLFLNKQRRALKKEKLKLNSIRGDHRIDPYFLLDIIAPSGLGSSSKITSSVTLRQGDTRTGGAHSEPTKRGGGRAE